MGDGHAAARQAEHDHVLAPGALRQVFGELASGGAPIGEPANSHGAHAGTTTLSGRPPPSGAGGRRAVATRPTFPGVAYQYSGAKCTNVFPRCSVQSWKAWASLIVTWLSAPQCGHREVARRSPGGPASVIRSGAARQIRQAKLAMHDRSTVVLCEPRLILNRRAHPSVAHPNTSSWHN